MINVCRAVSLAYTFTLRECLLFVKYLHRDRTSYLEYGSGVSTLIAGLKAKTVVSVEGDSAWMQNVSRRVERLKLNANANNTSVRLRHANIGPTGWLSYPRFRNATAIQYCMKPLRGSETFDVVLVDGRFRVACAAVAYTRLNRNGVLLVHDYRNRKHYKELTQLYSIVTFVESLAVFRRRPNRDWFPVFRKFLRDAS